MDLHLRRKFSDRGNAVHRLYQFGTQNNPSVPAHGKILQRLSDDDGLSWSTPTDVSAAGGSVGYPGATPGPGGPRDEPSLLLNNQ